MRLVVEVPESGSQWRYALVNENHDLLQHGQCVPELLPQAREIIAAIAPSQLSWHAVQLPKQSGARMRAVLEGLLEDQLLDEPAGLYLAVSDERITASEGKRWVMACNRAWLISRLDALLACGRTPQRLTAIHLPLLPDVAPQAWWHGAAGGEPSVVMQSTQGVWHLPSALLNPQAKEWQHRADPAAVAAAEFWLGRKVSPATWYELLGSCTLPANSVWGNLAQMELAHLGNRSWMQRCSAALSSLLSAPKWRAFRWGALALLVTNLVGLQVAAFQQKQAIAAKREALGTLLTQSFPQVKVVVDAPAQMRKLVEDARQRSGQLAATDFEVLLSAWATSAAGGTSNAPAGLEYRDGSLKVTPANPGNTP